MPTVGREHQGVARRAIGRLTGGIRDAGARGSFILRP